MDPLDNTAPVNQAFTAAEIGAIAHLYRGEVYRSTVWRTRLVRDGQPAAREGQGRACRSGGEVRSADQAG
jgi:uncharacterized membrane protein